MPDPSPNAAPPRSRRTLLWTATTYFGEGLPWSFLHQIATEFLSAIGASKTQIGSTSLLHLAVTFKFVWSPLVDLFGRRRTWLVLLQLILGAGCSWSRRSPRPATWRRSGRRWVCWPSCTPPTTSPVTASTC